MIMIMPEPALWFDSPTLINILTRVAVTAAPAYRLRDVTIDVSQALLVVAAIVIVFIDLIVFVIVPIILVDTVCNRTKKNIGRELVVCPSTIVNYTSVSHVSKHKAM